MGGIINVSSQVIKPTVTYIASTTTNLASSNVYTVISFSTPSKTPTYSYFSYNTTSDIFTNISGRTLSVIVTLNAKFAYIFGQASSTRRIQLFLGSSFAAYADIPTMGSPSASVHPCLSCSGAVDIADNETIYAQWIQNTGSALNSTAIITIQILN